ncbi:MULTISPECIES: hypothetical protein [Brevibacterium]|uniref:Uncharacterized protein n=1 Tax=Brevibacterium antiquum CNRZ 918 TaxID=1255637 RepID=A0A2H1J2A6_9MICO|nr:MULTISPECIES: hypothetical protein [Brevibacterium]SMX81607.1 hypothetical protein BANT918_01355 [Brevibacterium antiquum CNRZ 918]HCG56407.1 hypothetical protein [Brevibacterium sp.]
MNTNNTNHSTAFFNEDAVSRARLNLAKTIRTRLVVSVLSPAHVEPLQDARREVELLPRGEFTIYPETLEVSAQPAAEIDILADVEQPMRTFSEADLDRIRDTACMQIASGLTEPKTIVLLGIIPSTTVEAVRDKIVHPVWCDQSRREECYVGLVGADVEHQSTEDKIVTDSFAADAVMDLITDMADYRKDMTTPERSTITVRSLTNPRKAHANITGSPQELKVLGQFIIEQAERFQGYLDQVADCDG